MTKEINLIKEKIERAKMKRQELLLELGILKKRVSEFKRDKDLKKIELLNKQLLNNS